MGAEQNMEYTKSGMLMRFLKGSKRFFAGSILASILVAAMDMIAPQIIRIVVDGCLGEDLSQLPSLAQRTLAAVGGADYLREHLYLAGGRDFSGSRDLCCLSVSEYVSEYERRRIHGEDSQRLAVPSH